MNTILVVDDEACTANVVIATLEDEGYRVFSASNGLDALQRCHEVSPDLILVDFMMPFMDGAAMAQQIRNDPAHRSAAIVIVSGIDEMVIRSAFEGYDGYLRKPFRTAALLEIVRLMQQRTAAS